MSNEEIFFLITDYEAEDVLALRMHKDSDRCVFLGGDFAPDGERSVLVPKHVYNDIYGDSHLDEKIKSTEELLNECVEKCGQIENATPDVHELMKGYEGLMRIVRSDEDDSYGV